jgi:hypothetical protein
MFGKTIQIKLLLFVFFIEIFAKQLKFAAL